MSMNCLDCNRYLKCKDSKKSKDYLCDKFERREVRDLASILNGELYEEHAIDMSDVEGENISRRIDFTFADEKTNVAEMIEKVINSDLLTPVDTKLDDSAAPEAKNFFEFTTSQHFLNVKPYAKQMLYLTQLFSEYCPDCSNTKWMREGIKVGDSLAKFENKVKLLEYGVCPSCGNRKSELVKEGKLNQFQELAGQAGQRCIIGDSLIATNNGLEYISELDNNNDLIYGFNELSGSIVNGKFVNTTYSSIYKSKKEQTYRLELDNGMYIEGTKDHPVLTTEGYFPLALCNDAVIPVTFNWNSFGSNRLSTDEAKFLGYWLANGETTNIKIISEKCFKVVNSLFPNALRCTEGINFDYRGSYNKLESILEFPPMLKKEHIRMPRKILTADKETVRLFLSTFFEAFIYNNINRSNIEFFQISSKYLAQAIGLYLQMFGVEFKLKSNGIKIDSASLDFFSELFCLCKLESFSASEYSKYICNSENDSKVIYHIPVKSVSKGFISETYDFVVPETNSFIANGLVNHNSGKSAITAMASAYNLHKLLKLQKPNEVYGLLPANVLHGTFVALTYKQAAETLWEPFLQYVTDSPWFNLYHSIMDEHGKRYNDEFYKIKDTYISYKAKRILLYPAGPNKKTLRGRCLTGNTLINTNHGYCTLDELIALDGQHSIKYLIVDSHEGAKEVSHTYKSTSETIKLVSKNGFEVRGTYEHPMLCVNKDFSLKWKRLDEIKRGDYILSITKNNCPNYSNVLSPRDAKSLGYKEAKMVLTGDLLTDLNLSVRASSFESIKSYFQAYFEILATVSFETTSFYDRKHVIKIKASSINQAKQIQIVLFQSFNILSKFEEQKDLFSVYYLSVTGEDAVRMTEIFPSFLPVANTNYNFKDNSRRTIPFLTSFVRDVLKLHLATVEVSFDQLLKLVKIHSGEYYERLKQFVELGAHIEEVVSIDKVPGIVDVYDLTVPEGHCFTANCLTSHNTRFLSCLAGDSLVSTNQGLIKIKQNSLVGKNTYRGNSERKILSQISMGFKETYESHLENGLSLETTEDHEFLVFNGSEFTWKRQDSLLNGELLAVTLGGNFPEKLPLNHENFPRFMTKEISFSLGFLTKIGFRVNSAALIKEYLSYLETLVNLSLEENGFNSLDFNISNEFLEYLGLSLDEIPWSILEAPKECAISYLKPFKCDDGYTFNSKTLAKKAQILLLRLGIITELSFSSSFQYILIPIQTKYTCFETSLKFLHKGIYLVPFVFSESKGLKEVYDISVDSDDYTFTANGINVHNCIDEIGWFDNNKDEAKVKMNANEVYVALDRSLLTVRAAASRLIKQGFDDIPTGFAFNVSSPSSARDKIVELYNQSKNSRKILGFKEATWDMNPNITKDDLSEEFVKDPAAAERDYACNPPLSDNAFFSNFAAIEECFMGKQNKLKYVYAQRKAKDGSVTRYAKISEVSKSTKPNVLSIDAGYCVTGDTLICTSKGLLRIDSLSGPFPLNTYKGIKRDINLEVGGRYEPAIAKTLHYMGEKPVIKITTASGHSINATKEHPQLVLRNGQHTWVKLGEINIHDRVCFNKVQAFRKEKLPLNHSIFKEMNEELAYYLGCLCTKEGLNEVLSGFIETPLGNSKPNDTDRFLINYLGLDLDELDSIPWSILQADISSQKAFVAALFEFSGSYCFLKQQKLYIKTRTKEIRRQLQILLNTMGIMTLGNKRKIETANKRSAHALYHLITSFKQLRYSTYNQSFLDAEKLYSSIEDENINPIPSDRIRNLLLKRLIGEDGSTTKFYNDSWMDVEVNSFDLQIEENFYSNKYYKGEYSALLEALELISPSERRILESTLVCDYDYSEIVKIEDNGVESVFDLTMNDGEEPAYIANGMIIHNTNNSFSLVCGHLHQGLPVITCFCEVIPNPGMPLNHSLIFSELIYPLIKERNVKVLISDRWQNIKLLQDAEMEFDDLITISKSLRYDDFWVIKQMMFDSEVILPRLKRSIDEIVKYDQSQYPQCFTDPVEHLALQFMTVRDMGNTVDKGDMLTDDTFRAVCLAITALMDDELYEVFSQDGLSDVNNQEAIGHVITMTSGASGKNGEVITTSSGKSLGIVQSRR